MSDEIRGSCLCGEVAYEIPASDIGVITTCYCSLCRKNHGAERRLRASARTRGFRWVSGEQALRRYRYAPERQKVFCGICGTPLVNEYLDQPELLGLAIATLDQDPGKRNVLHHVMPKNTFFITFRFPSAVEIRIHGFNFGRGIRLYGFSI